MAFEVGQDVRYYVGREEADGVIVTNHSARANEYQTLDVLVIETDRVHHVRLENEVFHLDKE